ncbi:MAG: hypothetical protein ACI9LY_000837 [Arenicella sp.]|jgi:hypothetical protein
MILNDATDRGVVNSKISPDFFQGIATSGVCYNDSIISAVSGV